MSFGSNKILGSTCKDEEIKRSEKSEQSKDGGFLGIICCASGNVQEPYCFRTVEHLDPKEVIQNNKNNSDHKDEESRKPVTSSNDECLQVNGTLKRCKQRAKNISQTSETIEEHPAKLQYVLNDTDLVSMKIRKKKTKKSRTRSKEENNLEQNVKFAEILIKRLEDVLAKQNNNQVLGSNEKHTADIDRTVVKEKKEDLKLKHNDSVIEVRKASTTNKRNTHLQFNKGKTTYAKEKDNFKESNVREVDGKGQMQKLPNTVHEKDRFKQRSKNHTHWQNKHQNTYEECIVFDVHEQLRKPTHIQSNKYFIIRYDSDHDENEVKQRTFSQYNPFLYNVNEMKNGKFYRAISTKTCHSTPKQKGRLLWTANYM